MISKIFAGILIAGMSWLILDGLFGWGFFLNAHVTVGGPVYLSIKEQTDEKLGILVAPSTEAYRKELERVKDPNRNTDVSLESEVSRFKAEGFVIVRNGAKAILIQTVDGGSLAKVKITDDKNSDNVGMVGWVGGGFISATKKYRVPQFLPQELYPSVYVE